MQFHIPTLLVSLIASSTILTISFAWVAKRQDADGLSLWAWGLTLHTLAIFLLGLRDYIPYVGSIIGGNVAVALGYSLFAAALLQLQRRFIPFVFLWLPPLIIAGSFALLISNLHGRVIISGLVSCAQHLLILFLLVTHKSDIPVRGKYLMYFALGIMIPTLCLRSFSVIFDMAAISDIQQSWPLQVLILFSSLIAIALGSNGFLLMTKEVADYHLRLLAKTDKLTGVWNRRHSEEIAKQEIERQRRYEQPVSLVMADIDYFKEINDKFGHATGDNVLIDFCSIAQYCIRSTDILARWGGEEFLFILANTTLSSAAELAERVRNTLENHEFSGVGKVTASFGVTQLQSNESWANWLNRADVMLYRAKTAGRNRVEVGGT